MIDSELVEEQTTYLAIHNVQNEVLQHSGELHIQVCSCRPSQILCGEPHNHNEPRTGHLEVFVESKYSLSMSLLRSTAVR